MLLLLIDFTDECDVNAICAHLTGCIGVGSTAMAVRTCIRLCCIRCIHTEAIHAACFATLYIYTHVLTCTCAETHTCIHTYVILIHTLYCSTHQGQGTTSIQQHGLQHGHRVGPVADVVQS
jgi:hypothetical protein